MSVRTFKVLVVIGVCLACALGLGRRQAEDGLHQTDVHRSKGKQIPYVVYVPHDYDGTKAYPVIVYLHGAGDKKPIPWGLGTYIQGAVTSTSSASSPTRISPGIREGPARSPRSGA